MPVGGAVASSWSAPRRLWSWIGESWRLFRFFLPRFAGALCAWCRGRWSLDSPKGGRSVDLSPGDACGSGMVLRMAPALRANEIIADFR
jgi:hypothetical protein